MRILKKGTKIGKLEIKKRREKRRIEAFSNITGEVYRKCKHFY